MPTYTVQCDKCNSTHEGRAFDIDTIVGICSWCGDDACPDCDMEGDLHTECADVKKEDEAAEADDE